MSFTTGYSDDFVSFALIAPFHDIWQDYGGSDTLILTETLSLNLDGTETPYFMPGTSVIQAEGGILVTQYGQSLLLAEDYDAPSSVEFIEVRGLSLDGAQPPMVLATMQIVTHVDQIADGSFLYAGSAANERIVVPEQDTAPDGFSEIYGGGGNDVILLSASQSFRAHGGDGNDTIRAQGAFDVGLSGDAGDDRLIGADGDDTIWGGLGRDVIRGGAGDDQIKGDQVLAWTGGAGDRLFGGAGNDWIEGGAGPDVMTGGPGADTFAFDAVTFQTIDRITDFNAALDSIFIDTDTLPGDVTAHIENGNTLLRFAGETFAILEGTELTLPEINLELF